MATYVLVHGAWTGAHGFRRLRRLLQSAGHGVFTPSLTGLGERVHLVSPQIDLTTHIHDVVNAVLYEDLEDVVLLGFSYGGAVVTGAVAHLAGRIRELVFLDAFVPGDGDTVADLAGRPRADVIELGAEWPAPPPPRPFDDPAEAVWQNARRVSHPLRCFTEPVRLSRPLEEHGFGLTYVKATGDGRARARRGRVLDRGRARRDVTALALPRDRHDAHGRQQPPRRPRPHPARPRRSRDAGVVSRRR